MKFFWVILIGLASAATATSNNDTAIGLTNDKAARFVGQFATICAAGNGEFEAIKRLVKAEGYRKKPYLDHQPKSLFAERGSNTIVYRGKQPNCSLQSAHVPGGDGSRQRARLPSAGDDVPGARVDRRLLRRHACDDDSGSAASA